MLPRLGLALNGGNLQCAASARLLDLLEGDLRGHYHQKVRLGPLFDVIGAGLPSGILALALARGASPHVLMKLGGRFQALKAMLTPGTRELSVERILGQYFGRSLCSELSTRVLFEANSEDKFIDSKDCPQTQIIDWVRSLSAHEGGSGVVEQQTLRVIESPSMLFSMCAPLELTTSRSPHTSVYRLLQGLDVAGQRQSPEYAAMFDALRNRIDSDPERFLPAEGRLTLERKTFVDTWLGATVGKDLAEVGRLHLKSLDPEPAQECYTLGLEQLRKENPTGAPCLSTYKCLAVLSSKNWIEEPIARLEEAVAMSRQMDNIWFCEEPVHLTLIRRYIETGQKEKAVELLKETSRLVLEFAGSFPPRQMGAVYKSLAGSFAEVGDGANSARWMAMSEEFALFFTKKNPDKQE